jgi:glycosyltransferase involved in cell wall biosynthesis/ubiquinone/menaquinone biosynthesis C-methylase UbiE
MTKLSVLMPVYNESRTLRTIVGKVLASPVDAEIELVCVDDCSKDDSLEILEELADNDPRIKVIAQPVNMGKGKAIRTAIDHMSGDIGIIQDADLEYDPAEYPRVIAPIVDGIADAVYGSRFASSELRRVLFFWHSLGNKVLTTLSNMANDLNLTDMETCYKAVQGDLLKRLRLTSDRFGLEPEITARLARSGARIYEVPISYRGRTYAEGKNIGWRDGLEALWLIFKFRFIDTRHVHHAGHVTLESLANAPNIGRWTVDQFREHLGDTVLEAGCGSGNLTQNLIDCRRLICLDIDEAHLSAVNDRFGHLENVDVVSGDLDDPGTYAPYEETLDTVVCVNVLEHLSSPDIAAKGFAQSLRSGGHAVVLVPAHKWLFSAADRALDHTMRYSREDLTSTLEEAGLELVEVREFNRMGVLGWLVNKILHRTEIGQLQTRLFSWLMPLAKIIERVQVLPGLSWIAVARVPESSAK